jgi:hypothetical protein
VVTDRATYAYLGDVYVETTQRGRGLGKFLVSCVVAHPELQGLRRWALATADAHALYARHGFRPPANPDIHLFIERAPTDLWPEQAEREGTRLRQPRRTDGRPAGQAPHFAECGARAVASRITDLHR